MSGPAQEVFRSVLRERGWVEGRNLVFDLRYAEGDASRWEPLTQELLALKPDLLVTSTDAMALHAAQTSKATPIVFLYGIDPEGLGLVKSLSRPGGNVTGFSVLGKELFAKRLSLLKEALPGLRKVGLFISRDVVYPKWKESPAQHLGLEVVTAVVETPDDVAPAFAQLRRDGAQAVEDESGSLAVYALGKRLGELAIAHGLPIMTGGPGPDSGVLMAYGANIFELSRRVGQLADRILRGARPADIPVEQVTVYDFVVNKRTARALGIVLPPSILLQATRVIE